MRKAEVLAICLDGFSRADEDVEAALFVDAAAELRRLSAANAKLITATTRVLRSFPTDTDMHYLGWDQVDVDEACNAYDAAHAEIDKARES